MKITNTKSYYHDEVIVSEIYLDINGDEYVRRESTNGLLMWILKGKAVEKTKLEEEYQNILLKEQREDKLNRVLKNENNNGTIS